MSSGGKFLCIQHFFNVLSTSDGENARIPQNAIPCEVDFFYYL